MLANFLLDVIMLRQGRSVGETPILMHNLKLVKSSEVKDWKKFLLFNVQPGDYIFSPDIAKDMFSEITRQTQILDTLYLAVKRDPFNLALFWRHVDFFASMKGWFSETGLRATFKKDLFLRLWYARASIIAHK